MLEMMPGICQHGRTTWMSRNQKGKTSLDLNEARDDGVQDGSGPYANNLHLTPDRKHTNTSSLNFYRPDALPDAEPRQCQSTEGRALKWDVCHVVNPLQCFCLWHPEAE